MSEITAARIAAMLEGRAAAPEDWQEREALADGLSDSERGTLLPLAWRCEAEAAGDDKIRHLAAVVESMRRPARISSDAFAEGIAALRVLRGLPAGAVQEYSRLTPEEARDLHVADLLWRLVAGLDGAVPEAALPGLRELRPLMETRSKTKLARTVVVARLGGETAPAEDAAGRLLALADGELERSEWSLLLALPEPMLRDWLVLEDVSGPEIEPEDRHAALMRLLDAAPGYSEFAREVFAAAMTRFGAIAGGKVEYRADGAFSIEDCVVIERAALWGLWRNEDWCLDAIGPLWSMAVQAPDPKAKTVPSQSLAIRLGKAAVAEPRPEALRALDAAAATCRHAGVSKKLARFRRAARTALAAQPERLLALNPTEPVPKDMLKSFAAAVETLLALPAPISMEDWSIRFGPKRKEGWALAKRLIWEVTPGDGGAVFTALPEKSGGWRLVDGAKREAADGDSIRLWHPVETAPGLAKAWVGLLEREGLEQPFRQAEREIYPLPASESGGARSTLFAGHWVAASPLSGLARVSGWRIGYRSEAHLKLAGFSFCFDAGAEIYPGAGGEGETGAFWLEGPAAQFGEVPARVVSEALRKVDLLVAVGRRGVR